jgi:dihydroorotase
VFDPNDRWVVDATRLASKSRNSPFDGWKLAGRVRHTVLRGEPVVRDSEPER